MGIPDCIQDSFKDVSLQDCLWKDMSLTGRIIKQGLLGNKDDEYEFGNSWGESNASTERA